MLTSRVRNVEFENAESLDYSPITNYDGQGLCERMWFMPNINEYFQEYNDEMERLKRQGKVYSYGKLVVKNENWLYHKNSAPFLPKFTKSAKFK